MFGTVAFGMLVAAVVVIVGHLIASLAARGRGGAGPVRGLGRFGSLVYLVMIVSVGVLAVTSLRGMLGDGELRGWLLMGHMTASGAFIVSLLLAVILWASACEVCATDGGLSGRRFSRLTRYSFWFFATASLVTLGTMVLSMFPLLSTHQTELMFAVHRYAGLAMVAAIVVHLYSVSLGRIVAGSQQAPASTH